MKTTFSTTEVLKALGGIKRERLREWIIKGFIPIALPSKVQGRSNEYSIEELYALAIFKKLVDDGTSRAIASKVYLKVLPTLTLFTVGYREFPPYLLIEVDGEEVMVYHSDSSNMMKKIVDQVGWEIITIVNLKAMKSIIDERLRAL